MPLYSFLVRFMYEYVGHITFMLDSFLFLCLKDVDLSQVIAKLEGVAVSQYCALRLLQVTLILKLYQSYIISSLYLISLWLIWSLYTLQATLDDSLYELAGELVRILDWLLLIFGHV